jgi:hypothetical protein
MLGRASEAAIMLDSISEIGSELTVAEGFETALTAYQVGQRPVWALGSVGAIAKFPILDRVAILNILAEAGDPSARAIDECADRWMDAGREVFLVNPKAAISTTRFACLEHRHDISVRGKRFPERRKEAGVVSRKNNAAGKAPCLVCGG